LAQQLETRVPDRSPDPLLRANLEGIFGQLFLGSSLRSSSLPPCLFGCGGLRCLALLFCLGQPLLLSFGFSGCDGI
jgi:hypothetical protein